MSTKLFFIPLFHLHLVFDDIVVLLPEFKLNIPIKISKMCKITAIIGQDTKIVDVVIMMLTLLLLMLPSYEGKKDFS
jgi:hypothetical protein